MEEAQKNTEEVQTGPANPESTTTSSAPSEKVTVESLKYNSENKLMVILSTFGLLGGLIALVEEKDMFVKYHGMQFGILGLIMFIWGFIPVLNLLIIFAAPVFFVIWVVGILKVLKGEVFVMPLISDLALSFLNR